MKFLRTINITSDEIAKGKYKYDFDYYASGDYVCNSLWVDNKHIITNDNCHFPIEEFIDGYINGYTDAMGITAEVETAILVTSNPYNPNEDNERYFLKKEGK